MRVDSHQHFWRYTEPEYSWIEDAISMLRQDFLPADLSPLLEAEGYARCIAVQARQTLEENDFLLGMARDSAIVEGVVGWVDLASPEVAGDLETYAGQNGFVGVRHIVQGEPAGFLARDDFRRGVGLLQDYGLTYDILIRAHQLPEAIDFAEAFPDQPFVLDHAAKPDIANGQWEPWAGDLKRLSRLANVWCKISGLSFEANWDSWTADTLRPYVNHVLDCFGPARCMIGSDWPMCLPAGDYSQTMSALETCLGGLSDDEREGVLADNAATFYGLY
jgi:L-fuconolactonase